MSFIYGQGEGTSLTRRDDEKGIEDDEGDARQWKG
jgi:hypothetical protein